MEYDVIYNADCMSVLENYLGGAFDLTLTDIPYNAVHGKDYGRAKYDGVLRNLDKQNADTLTFDLDKFLNELFRVTKGTIIIFCGEEQLSTIYKFFEEKQQQRIGTVRHLVWQKTNPSPMNGQYIYLSGIENAIWFKKKGAAFNAFCKSNVFYHPCGRSKLHPTEKNHELLRELIRDNSNPGDIIFDPCCGSGAHCLVAKEEGRKYVGIELNTEYYNIAKARLQ